MSFDRQWFGENAAFHITHKQCIKSRTYEAPCFRTLVLCVHSLKSPVNESLRLVCETKCEIHLFLCFLYHRPWRWLCMRTWTSAGHPLPAAWTRPPPCTSRTHWHKRTWWLYSRSYSRSSPTWEEGSVGYIPLDISTVSFELFWYGYIIISQLIRVNLLSIYRISMALCKTAVSPLLKYWTLQSCTMPSIWWLFHRHWSNCVVVSVPLE